MLCWACLFLSAWDLTSASFSGENSMENRRGGWAGHDSGRSFALPAVSETTPGVLQLQTAGAAGLNPSPVQLHPSCPWAGTANIHRSVHVLLAVFNSLTKAVSARALSGSSHHSSATLPVLSLGLLSTKAEIADPKCHDAVSWLCDPESFLSCATW